MRVNAWKIEVLPERVYKLPFNLSGSEERKEFNSKNVYGRIRKDDAVFFFAEKKYVEKKYRQLDLAEFGTLSLEHQKSLLYQIIDSKFKGKGFKFNRKNRLFHLPQDSDTGLLKYNEEHQFYLNIGFRYSIEELNNRLIFLLVPEQVVTKDGKLYDSHFAHSVNPKILSDSSLAPKYRNYCEILEEVTKIIGTPIGLDFGECGSLIFEDAKQVSVETIPEPEIDFGSGKYHSWAKIGLEKYHPLDYNEGFDKRPTNIKIAFIGTRKSFEFMRKLNEGESGKKYPFKGFQAIYKSELKMDNERFLELKNEEIENVELVTELLDLLKIKISSLKNRGVDFNLCLIELVPKWQPFFNQKFDLHDLIKVDFWKLGIPTQILTSKANENIETETLGNFALGIYFKAGGNPWRLKTQFLNNAYIGISFGYSSEEKKRLVGFAEIFDAFGQFVSLRSVTIKEFLPGKKLESKRDVHLTSDQFTQLVNNLLADYNDYLENGFPENVIIHKTTYFNEEELKIEDRLQDFPTKFSLVHIQNDHFWRLLTPDKKEPTRGSLFQLSSQKAILYTSGILASQSKYFFPGSPHPLIMNLENQSNYTIEEIAYQIMELTKLNFNSTNTYSREPVTLLHSRGLINLLRAGLEPNKIPTDPRYFL